MPALAPLHPIIVHAVLGLLPLGVLLRGVSLFARRSFVGPAALLLLLCGAIAGDLAERSGSQAHKVAAGVLGSAEAVHEHEEWGQRTRNVFLIVAVLELAAWALRQRRPAQWVRGASFLVGLGGLFCLYEAGEHGGELVYKHAMGVGVRRDRDEDIAHLFKAGVYYQSDREVKAGRIAEAAQLWEWSARRWPEDLELQLWVAESLWRHRGETKRALAMVEGVQPENLTQRLRRRYALLKADLLWASGKKDETRSWLKHASTAFPRDRRITEKASQLEGMR